MTERYYFASRYSRNAELREYRDQITDAIPGTVVTSRWIDCHGGELAVSYTPDMLAADPEACWKHGQADLEDLSDSTAIVSFTGPGGKGGRHVEHGIAIAYADNGPWLAPNAAQYRLIVVGPREHIFHCHPATEVYPTWDAFLAAEVARQKAQVAA